jgi:hypothetical protein
MAVAFVAYAWPAFLVGLIVVALGWRRLEGKAEAATSADDSPLQLGAALQMAALFQIAIIVITAVTTKRSGALMFTSAMVGLTDVDSLTVSLARAAPGLAPGLAARGLAAGVIANTLLKLVLAVGIGRGTYRLVAGLVLAVIAASVAAMLMLR